MSKNLIPKFKDGYEVALIFDGLQLRTNDIIDDEIINECSLYSIQKTGYDIEFKIKPFDSPLELPENLENNDNRTSWYSNPGLIHHLHSSFLGGSHVLYAVLISSFAPAIQEYCTFRSDVELKVKSLFFAQVAYGAT